MTASKENKDEQYIQEAREQEARKHRGFSATGNSQTSRQRVTQPTNEGTNEGTNEVGKVKSRLEQDRFFIEAASDRRGAQLADAVAAASYRKAMHLLNQGYSGELTQQAMQELADEWNSDDFSDIGMGETIGEGNLRIALPSSTGKNYFALPSAKDRE